MANDPLDEPDVGPEPVAPVSISSGSAPSGSHPLSPYLQPGAVIGPYRIESLVDRGGMAYVYVAMDLRLTAGWRLKVLALQDRKASDFRERFMRESRFAASLDHPNIVPIYEAGEADGLLYIAMRYVRGTNLAEVYPQQSGPWIRSARWPSCLRSPTHWTPRTPPAWCIGTSSRRTFCWRSPTITAANTST